MDLELAGRSAIVTGASRGIGRAIAEALAAEGARVALCARGTPALEAAAERVRRAGAPEALPIAADVTEPSDCERLVETAAARLGGVDVLINNAGDPSARASCASGGGARTRRTCSPRCG